jgi:hypothetical protein
VSAILIKEPEVLTGELIVDPESRHKFDQCVSLALQLSEVLRTGIELQESARKKDSHEGFYQERFRKRLRLVCLILLVLDFLGVFAKRSISSSITSTWSTSVPT